MTLEPATAVEVESPGTWTLGYEASGEGIRQGGAIALHVWPEWGWTAPQIEDPRAPGFIDFHVEGSTARLRALRVSPDGTLHDAIWLRVEEGALAPGARVEIEYRNATAGRFAGRHQGFAIFTDADGDGTFRRVEPAATLDVVAGAPADLWVVARSPGPEGDGVEARVSLLDRWGNLIRTRGMQGAVPAVFASDEASGLSGISSRIWRPGEAAERRVYWGDLHGHAGWSDGVGAPEDYYRYARDAAGLDFAALTEHDAIGPFHLDAGRWSGLIETAEAFHAPGRFVTLFGYEYTNWATGHLTVLSPSSSLPLLSAADPRFDRVEELWAELAKLEDVPVLTVPHHSGGSSMATDWSHFDPRFVRTVELFSVHGSSECYRCAVRVQNPRRGSFVLDALQRGYRLAFIGSGDTHNGHPGRNPRLRPHRTGLAGVWARALTRDAIWEAIEGGHSFATTGARILPRLGRDGDSFTLDVRAADEIAKVEILKNGRVAYRRLLSAVEVEDRWRDPQAPESGDFYYLRVTESSGHMAWTSPIYVP
ncbi:MAG: CehA/McbA family metallohydrolase [Myxococcota bacterium]